MKKSNKKIGENIGIIKQMATIGGIFSFALFSMIGAMVVGLVIANLFFSR